jgi:hypothetical protein
LDELHEFILIKHLARSDCEIAPDLECHAVRVADLEAAASGFDILDQHPRAGHQVSGIR